LEAYPEYDQKALEVRTPLVQNGADEQGPDRGEIAVEWAHFGLTALPETIEAVPVGVFNSG
jgi:hypothetical protein